VAQDEHEDQDGDYSIFFVHIVAFLPR
jgi:hypothetical protein